MNNEIMHNNKIINNNAENKSVSQLSQFSQLTQHRSVKSYYIRDIPSDLWLGFTIAAKKQGLTIHDAVLQALAEYADRYGGDLVNVNFATTIQVKRDLLQFAVEEEVRLLLCSLKRAHKRNAPKTHIDELKLKIINNIKKCPFLNPDLAEEIKRVFKLVADKV